MLHNLYVKNLALIDEIDIELQKGLNILTGETGAGKSIILGSINLALGGRYTSDILRSEDEPGYVELTFDVENELQLAVLREKDIYPEDGMITLSRKMIGKRSVSKVNGETVSIAELKEIAELLIDIHGQHEHQSLLYKKNHLPMLDAYAKEDIKDLKSKVEESYRLYKSLSEELEHGCLDEKERNKEISFLEFEINEIRCANLKENEDDLLENQYRKMLAGQKITGDLEEAYGYLNESNMSASDLISRAIRCLLDAAKYDDKSNELLEQLSEVDGLLNDLNRELVTYKDSFDFKEEDFYESEKRLNEINHLKSKYGNTINEILTYCEEKEKQLFKLKEYDVYIEQLKEKLNKSESELLKYSEALSTIRMNSAKEMQENIKESLLDLHFLDVQFEIKFERTKGYHANGIDEIEFMISTNPGEPLKPLTDVASGGELSRIMLAIKTILAKKDYVETLIFDEIDVGISGRTAQKVSEKMALIAKNHQVICITHLAQIAAMADAHYVIEKHVSNNKTKTEIHLLNKDEEIEELARILGGAEITETVMRSAAEMKELAVRTKLNQT